MQMHQTAVVQIPSVFLSDWGMSVWTFGLLASVPWNPAVPDAVDEEETYRIIYNIYIYIDLSSIH